MGRVIHGCKFKVGLPPRLAQMLSGQWRHRIHASTGLHGFDFLLFGAALAFVRRVDTALNGAFILGGVVRFLSECSVSWSGVVPGHVFPRDVPSVSLYAWG